ncbi:uncharacterized protein METZ01_LOCUS279302, partial [marine metagenome]
MFKDLFRFIQILNILFKARLDSLIREYSSSRWIAIFYLSPWQVFSSKKPRGERIFQALEEAGPIFIKFGQLLSTRPDLIPKDIAHSLSRLQDNLTPFSTIEAKNIIEKELDNTLDEIFSCFVDEPIAAASIAQVYKATLKTSGEEVAVKVVRPGINKKISRD